MVFTVRYTRVRELHALGKLFHGEIFRRGAHAKFRRAHIYSVRTVQDGKFQAFQIARWAQQFGSVHDVPLFKIGNIKILLIFPIFRQVRNKGNNPLCRFLNG